MAYKLRGCLEWRGRRLRPSRGAKTGYGYIDIGCRRYLIHRLVWEIGHDQQIPKGMYVMHRCDNPCCYKLAHLVLGTPHDNSQDSIRKGRAAHGPRHPNAKLNSDDVLFIRHSGLSRICLAHAFRISPNHITDIRKKRKWLNDPTNS
jgi:hypothetical protein